MGRTGAELSDLAIITSDNPRSEDPAGIIEQVRVGAEGVEGAEIVVIEDRREAISRSLEGLTAGDTVVIAGKGHEQGQEFEQGRKIPFDDREVLRDEIEARVGQEGG
jgi:UDP-N-acetylmuramoyl-L-alanyl-D-glutamate--2,6-diaminopimelate ligase